MPAIVADALAAQPLERLEKPVHFVGVGGTGAALRRPRARMRATSSAKSSAFPRLDA
jgi:hypothetical protein